MKLLQLLPFAFVALAVPALAAEELTTGDHLIAAFLGMADGGAFGSGMQASKGIKRVGAGHLELTGPDDKVGTIVVTEKAACVYEVKLTGEGIPPATLQIDLNTLTSATYTEASSAVPRLKSYALALTGAPETVRVVGQDGQLSPAGLSTQLGTSLTLAELQSAMTKVRDACPGTPE